MGRSFRLAPTAACSCCRPAPSASVAGVPSPARIASTAAAAEAAAASASARRAPSERAPPRPPSPPAYFGAADAGVPRSDAPPGVEKARGVPAWVVPAWVVPAPSPKTARFRSCMVPSDCVNCATLAASRSSAATSTSRTSASARFNSSAASRQRTSALAAAARTRDSEDSVFTASDAANASRARVASDAALSARATACSNERHSRAAAPASRAAVSARFVARSHARSAADAKASSAPPRLDSTARSLALVAASSCERCSTRSESIATSPAPSVIDRAVPGRCAPVGGFGCNPKCASKRSSRAAWSCTTSARPSIATRTEGVTLYQSLIPSARSRKFTASSTCGTRAEADMAGRARARAPEDSRLSRIPRAIQATTGAPTPSLARVAAGRRGRGDDGRATRSDVLSPSV